MPLPSLPSTARGIFPCAQELVYRVLADYDAWREWMPSLTSSRLLTREDILAIVELRTGSKDAEALMDAKLAELGE